MTKKSLGYVELEWTCPNCGGKNPGMTKLCQSCGAAQPGGVEFEQAAEEQLITDEDKLTQAQAGPDVHCAYCGARNPAGAETCKRCGGDLTQARARESGEVLGAHRSEAAAPVRCPACGNENPASARQCSTCGASLAGAESTRPAAPAKAPAAPARANKGMMAIFIGIAVVLCIGLIVYLVLANRTQDTIGQVEDVHWSRGIVIEALQPVTYEDWYTEIPVDAELGACSLKYHHSENEPVEGAREVCGTPYTVDTGSGAGEVVQDCVYEVDADWCEYTVLEWGEFNVITQEGDDLNPSWPQLALTEDEREGEQREAYEVTFSSDGELYRWETNDSEEFSRYRPGSKWTLEINTFDQLMGVAPAD